MARYNCLLIDLDNTLLDFDAAQRMALERLFAACDIAPTPENFSAYESINQALWAQFEKGQISKGKLLVRRFAQLLEALGREGDAQKMNEAYLAQLAKCGPILPGADEFLEEMAEVATIAVVSNGVYKAQKGRIADSGLGKYFDAVFVSEKMGCQKPQKRFFDAALKNLGVSNRQKVLVIGDSLAADIRGGVDSGLDTCWFNPGGAENTTDWKPTYTVQGYEQLKPIIYGEDGMPDEERRERHRDGR